MNIKKTILMLAILVGMASPLTSSAQQFIPFLKWTNATGTNATTTNFFSTTASTSNLYVGTGAGCLQVTGGKVLSTGSNCGSGGGTPGGSDTQIQFNDSSSFGGSAKLTFNKTTGALTLGDGLSDNGFFTVRSNTGTDVHLDIASSASTDDGGFYFATRARGTLSSPTTLADGDVIGGYVSAGYDGSSNIPTGALVYAVDGTVSAGVVPSQVRIYTSSAAGLVQALTADSSQRVGIGTTTPKWLLQLATTTRPQLTLTDGITADHWSFRNAGGILYLATSSPSTFATSTQSALSIGANGQLTMPFYTGTGCAQFGVGGLLSNTGVACGTGGGASNSKWATTTNNTGIVPNGGVTSFVGIATTTNPVSPLSVGTTTLSNTAFAIGAHFGPRGMVSGGAAGTVIGGNFDAGATNLIDLQVGGTSEFKVDVSGNLTVPLLVTGSSLVAGSGGVIGFSTRSRFSTPSDGVLTAFNSGSNGFTRLNFGGTTTAAPALTISTYPGIAVTLADGTNGGVFAVGTSTPRWTAQFASSTRPQLALSDGSLTSDHWTFRSINNSLFLATSSAATFATSTKSALSLDPNGVLSLGNYADCDDATHALAILSNAVVCNASISDARLKTNIRPIATGLSTISQLKPVSFFFRDLSDPNTRDPREQVGFLAQDVMGVIPNAINPSTPNSVEAKYTGSTKVLTLDKTAIIPYLVSAIQEQQKQIDELKAEVKNLKK